MRDLDGQRMRSAHHELIRAARTYGYKRIGLVRAEPPLAMDSLKAVVEGCVMGTFERRSRQTGAQPERREIEELVLTGFGIGREHEVVAAQENGEATNRTREWQNAPPNELTPDALAQEAQRIAQRHELEVEILGPKELRAGGYNLILGVASGSANPPRLVRLRYRGSKHPGAQAQAGAPVLALIGKGVTFDSGGISIKPAENMSQMKGDMAGAAAVLSAIDVIASRKVPIDVMAVIAATENMPGPAAQRPGDVVVSADGTTVEIVNTDAEGRLVLADALTHALRNGATHLVDLATLTGAARIAIGHAATAAVSNDDKFWDLVARAAADSGDRVWRLPIFAEFAGGKPWAHLDIASSSWNTNTELTTVLRGPSGAGTRLCIALAELMSGAER